MRGLSLIGGLVLLLPVLVAHADEVELFECQCLCALNCRAEGPHPVCETVACDAVPVPSWGQCTLGAMQLCEDRCCRELDPPPPLVGDPGRTGVPNDARIR
jgi:hypothetical protein